MSEIVDRLQARELLLSPKFQPKRKDIPTPQLLLDAGFPPESLRLVGFAADEASDISKASNDDTTLYVALCVCRSLRWRADNESIFNMADASALVKQDVDLLNDLALIVKPFLGLGPKAVEAAKNGLNPMESSAGGTESPAPPDSPPSESANPV